MIITMKILVNSFTLLNILQLKNQLYLEEKEQDILLFKILV